MNYFSPQLSEQDANKISMLGLAHIGDGVYELLVRTMLCTQGHAAVGELHRLTVARVRAPAQAKAMERLLPLLDEGELALGLIRRLREGYPGKLALRYKIEETDTDLSCLEEIGRKRGCLRKGGEIDYGRAASILLDEYRSGVLGRISLETAPDKVITIAKDPQKS